MSSAFAVIPGPAADEERGDKNTLGLSETRLRELGIEICQELDASDVGKGKLPKIWEFTKQLYDLDPEATNLMTIEGMGRYVLPLWKPKADRIVDTVLASITGPNVYVQIVPRSEKLGDKEKTGRLEKALMTMATTNQGKLGFDRAFRGCLKIAINTCIAFMYVYVTEEGEVRFEFIDPVDFCVYGHERGDLALAKAIGHKFWQYKSEITAKYDDEHYLTDEVGGGNFTGKQGSQSQEFQGTTPTPARVPEDELIECWQVVRRCDLGESESEHNGKKLKYSGTRDYIFEVARQSQRVLRVTPMDYKKSRMYFPIQFDEEYGSIWPPNSPGIEMSNLQIIYSDALNALMQGGWATSVGALLISGLTLKGKVTHLTPGLILEGNENAKAQQLYPPFNGQYLTEVIGMVEKMADLMSRVSPLGQGSPLPAHTSATAAAGMLQAQKEGQGAYAAFIAPVLAQIFEFLAELLEVHWDKILSFYGDLGLEDAADMEIASRYVTTAKSPSNNPVANQQKLAMLLTMAQQPGSNLDYSKVEKAVIENADLPFDVIGLFKAPGPSVKDLTMIMEGYIMGAVSKEEIIQVLTESQKALGLPPPTPEGQDGRNAGQLPEHADQPGPDAGPSGNASSPFQVLAGPGLAGAQSGSPAGGFAG